jgi:4-diphosphocytidyl-2-C-methyl-D-erythritol kinase
VGEDLTRLDPISNTDVVLAFPAVSVSTAWAYKAAKYNLTRSGEYEDYLGSVEGVKQLCAPSVLSNDLEQAVVSAHPAIADHLSALRQTDSFFVSMTGSGSAVFGLYDGAEAAGKACRELKAMGVSAVHTTLS